MPTIQWRKSTYSNDNGQCVELALQGQAVRDSKNPTGPHLRVTASSAAAFLAAAKSGRFDG